MHNRLATCHFLRKIQLKNRISVSNSELQVCVRSSQDCQDIHEGIKKYDWEKVWFQMNYRLLFE